ncbi:beta-galactosidase [Ceratitis capitata]|uniref:beta-galactosidase n=1 Tax=Ceratitis capitata TaxID=7213 RepID=UPI000329F90B|nr:beta-galactosidase [Ceratitis capitata]
MLKILKYRFVALLSFACLLVSLEGCAAKRINRSFTIDHENDTFLMDGLPFRYVSGSFHYFRALPQVWEERLKTMRAAGLNAIDTYIEWSLHNPHDGSYIWDGIADIERFLELAHSIGFYVVLRPGPYICAERDNGGLPHWLFTKYPEIKVRTSDPNYQLEVSKWYAQLMPRLQRYFYGNGGPIITVQIENEYGAFYACDAKHLIWLRDETEKYVRGNAVLFTTDQPNEGLKCGKIEGVHATVDFGIGSNFDQQWAAMRSVQPTGPLVNSEFYPGWLTHWSEENQRRDGMEVANSLRRMLEAGASVNFYMFFGGTNFGFTAGANNYGKDYVADITSYDYDAVMDEAGNITEKFALIRKVISDFIDVPHEDACNGCITTQRYAYGKVSLKPITTLLSKTGRTTLGHGEPIKSEKPLTFENLDQYSGLVLYETELPHLEIDPTVLTVNELHDRAFVFVDNELVGTLSCKNNISSLPLSKGWGSRLQILVENQGRINYETLNDTKGILGAVTVERFNGEKMELKNWLTTSFPLESEMILPIIGAYKKERASVDVMTKGKILRNGPVVFLGEFKVEKLGDTYFNPTGWGKGVVYVNGFNLGRYWPLVGPQLTLYLPKDLLKVGNNSLVLLEYQRANLNDENGEYTVTLDDQPQLDRNGGV